MSEEVPTEVNSQVTDANQAVAMPEVDENMETAEHPAVSIEDAKSAVKEEVVNEDAVALDEKAEEPEEESAPSFFVEEDDIIKIEVDILYDKSDGKIVSVSRSGLLGDTEFNKLGLTKEWFEFRPVGYEEMSNYRQRCGKADGDGSYVTDPVALRNFIVVWHLKDWSMRDREGKKIELKFSENGSLDDESIQVVYKTHTTMLEVVLTLFEKDMML